MLLAGARRSIPLQQEFDRVPPSVVLAFCFRIAHPPPQETPMTHRMLHALAPVALGLLLSASAPPVQAAEASGLDYAGAKAKAAETGKLVLIDFSSPT